MRLSNEEVLFTWPLATHTITAGWYYSDGKLHRAIDLRAAVGTPVYAAEDGTVDWVQAWNGHSTSGDQSYGNLVRIRHADYNGGKLQTLYAHLKESKVKYGQAVKEGELIGYSGNTGNSTGPHLHFEVRLAGTRYNPLNWLDSDFDVASDSVRLGNFTSVVRPAEDSREYVYGIDVSRYQGDIDWAQVAASGVKFALLRAGSQNNSGPYIDPYFERNYANAKAAGIAVGAYIYTYAETEAEQNDEILTILPALEGKTFEYPVFVDVEDKSLTGIGKAALTHLVKRYMDIIDQKGFVPGWYSYTNYINSYLCPEVLADYPLWVADYRSSLGYTGDYHIWQYTSSGTVPGISGKVDLNRDYHHYIASTGAPAEEQPATPELHKLSISLPGADADKAAEIIRKAADLGLAPDVTVETLPASAGDIKTLTEMADAAGGVAAMV